MSTLVSRFSKLQALPGLHWLSPAAPETVAAIDRAGFAQCQELAFAAAREVASLLQEGWTERQAADLLNTYLEDSGVRSFFHRAFVWFGDRTRFEGIGSYAAFAPTSRVIRPGEAFILDVAPIFKGYTCDIGYSGSLGPNAEVDAAKAFLAKLRADIPRLFNQAKDGASACRSVDDKIEAAGFEPIHHRYPFAVLGHRVHHGVLETGGWGVLNFGWQSYWEFLSRGLFGQLLNTEYAGRLDGLWAIEPHIGRPGFGAKFEEILVIENGRASWLAARSGAEP